MFIESTKDLRKREGRNVSKLTSVYSTHSIRSTAFHTYKDGSVYSLQSMVFPKDLTKSQKDMRKLLASQKKKRENEVENLHKQFLSQDFNLNFRTINSETSSATKILKTEESTGRLDLNRFRVISDKDRAERTITQESRHAFKRAEQPVILYTENSLRNGSSLRKSTNYEFMKNYDFFARSNYAMQFKNQHLCNLKEDKQNEVGQVEEEIQSAREIGNLMTETFDIKFKEYLTSLNLQKEREKSTLEDLKQGLLKIDFDLKKLKYNISRQKVVVEKLVEYRNFLMCVKERLRCLPSHFFTRVQEDTDKENEDHLNKVLTTLSSKKNTRPTHLAENLPGKDRRRNSLLPKRKAAVKILQEELSVTDRSNKDRNNQNKANIYLYENIYDTKEEFLSDLTNLEKDSMEAMTKFSENKIKLNDLNKRFEKAKTEDSEIQNMCYDKIILNEKLLKDLRIKNKILQSEQKRLLDVELEHDRINKFTFFVSNVWQPSSDKKFNFLQTLSNVHKYVQSILPKDFLERNNISLMSFSKHDDNIFKHKLKQTEKIFNVLLEKYNFYKNNKVMSALLTEIEIEFAKDRKSHKAKEQIVKDSKVRSEVHDIILKKANSIVILPKRRVTMRFKPLKRKTTNEKKIKENEDDREFQDLITYDDEKDK